MTPKTRRRLLRVALAALLLLVVLVLSAGPLISAIAPGKFVQAPNQDVEIDPASDPRGDALSSRGITAHHRIAVGPPEASLSVYVMDPPSEVSPRGTVFLLHGIRASKESLTGMGHWLAGLGFRSVLMDHRGHGRSTGRYLSFGVIEAHDAEQVLRYLDDQGLIVAPIGAMGFSYGAVVAIQFAALCSEVRAVVSVAAFASLRDIYRDRVASRRIGRHLVSASRLEGILRRAGEIAGFDPADADAARAARRCSAPVLILHGTEDRSVLPTHAHALAAALGDRGRLVMIPGEGHNSIFADRTGTVRREAAAWFDRWLQPESGR